MASLRHTGMRGRTRAEGHTELAPIDSLRAESYQIESFDYLRTRRSPQLLGLAVRTPSRLPAAARPSLIVERATLEQVFAPVRASSSPIADDGTGDWLWRGVFAVPSDMTFDPESLFTVQMLDRLILALPAPSDRRAHRRGNAAAESMRAWPHAVRRGLLVVVVTCQLGVMPGWMAGGALADGRAGADASVETAGEGPAGTPQPGEGEAEAQPEEEAPQPPSEPTPQPPSEPSPAAPEDGRGESPAPSQSDPVSTPPVQSSGGAVTQTSAAQPSPAAPAASAAGTSDGSTPSGSSRPARAERSIPSAPALHTGSHDGRSSRKDATAHKHASPRTSPSGPTPVSSEFSGVPIFEGLPPGLANIQASEPPPYLVPIYKAAGRRYHVPWRVLAAINEVETGYGQNLSVSSAGALGWMQFMPATWQEWGVDADKDGHANPYSPQDAIFTAARYLDASGASRDLAGAVFAYNHADWYVTEVLLKARMLGDTGSFAPIERGYSLPLDARYMQELGRTDDGVDIETPPDGALVYSMTPGVVSAVASDPAGFGPSYPVIEATAGSLEGQYVYYGHVAQALVAPGEHVSAGQPIALVGHTGDAASLGHGHIEIGFSDAGGAPVNQHGAEAWTPAGSVMRAFMVELSAAFGVHNA
jgi:murein DD-endopeptidase MepM/ murein hydrolase activator NlpD